MRTRSSAPATASSRGLDILSRLSGALGTPLHMIQVLIALVLLGIGVWLFLKAAVFLVSLAAPSRELVILPFEAGSDEQKRQAPAILSAKLRELQRSRIEVPVGYGLLNVPLLVSTPREASAPAPLSVLNDFQLKIKDVDVNALLRAFDAVLAPVHYELRGTITQLPTSFTVTSQLVRRGAVVASWEARTNAPAGGGSLEEVLDELIFKIVHDFATRSEFRAWQIQLAGRHTFRNWQSLRAYVRGLRALGRYQAGLEHKDLLEALDFFGRLVTSDPEDPYGLYFRGIALSEDRREAEAVADFQQLQRLLARLASPHRWGRMAWEAQLNEATARLKLYRLDAALEAVASLNGLIAELEAASSNESKALVALGRVQLAHTHATILSFLRNAEGDRSQVDAHLAGLRDNVTKAEEGFRAAVKGGWVSEREGLDIRFRLRNTQGYGTYRAAYFEAGTDEAYREQCRQAIAKLEEANGLRPNHYAVLQNLAMIYADERFDPKGDFLPEAQRLFERTQEFLSNDYYEHEQLAMIYARRAEMQSAAAAAQSWIEKGTKAAARALELRGESGVSLHALARLSAKSWELQKDGASATNALRAFAEAMPRCGKSRPFQDEYVALLKGLARARENDAEGMNDLAERLLTFLKAPQMESRRKELAGLGRSWSGQALAAADPNRPAPPKPRQRAEDLQKAFNEL